MKRNSTGYQQSITAFFKKPKCDIPEDRDVENTSSASSSSVVLAEPSFEALSPESVFLEDTFDISVVVGTNVDDELKMNILRSTLLPEKHFRYPTRMLNNQKRSFQEQWVTHTESGFPFLAYSVKFDGVFCKICLLFYSQTVGKGSHEMPGKLVATAYTDWRKARENFTKHAARQYHKDSMVMANSFLNVVEGKQASIANHLNRADMEKRLANRAAIRPIIETLLICAELELPLRGDEDSGPLSLNRPEKQDGKFRTLLRFRANSGDINLQQHIINSPRNATYISPEIQNEILSVCASNLLRQIVTKIGKSWFSIQADETMDVSGREQLSLCIRYVDANLLKVREDFVGFVRVESQGAENLAQIILEKCSSLGLNMQKCIGQGYDGASNMAGHLSGVQARIREKYPKARYFHCASHKLNLALSNAMKVAAIRNCLGRVGEITNLFRNNNSANLILQQNIAKNMPESKKSRLVRLCETRFVERYDAIITFLELLETIYESLEDISLKQWQISSSASTFLASIEKSEFLVAMHVCENLLSITLPLSVALQTKSMDMISAINHSAIVIDEVRSRRTNAAKVFKALYKSAETLKKKITGTPISIPRVAQRSARPNPQVDGPEDYFRVAVFVPTADNLLANLSERFQNNSELLKAFQALLPGFRAENVEETIKPLFCYFLDTNSVSAFTAEYELWYKTLAGSEESEVMHLLQKCNKIFFPTIHSLLTALASLPVTTASVERSFSAMKRIKTLPRNLTGDHRLSDLAILAINRDFNIDFDEVIDSLAKSKNRKIML